MLYREQKKDGNQLSILGLGCMRFHKKGNSIDQEEAEKLMKAAIDMGVNYFDTAYIYSGSEVCLGKFLKKGYRDKVNIATKLPHYLLKSAGDIDKYFEEQKRRLQTDHIEYYLMHMLNDAATWERLKGIGIEEWIAKKKASGEIKNIGFSFHGGPSQFIPLLDAYDWDFTQIQYNYMDEHTQAGLKGLEYAGEKGIPVIIMEPLRGGKLVQQLPSAAKREFEAAECKRTPAEWALRWIWNHPQVSVILSGMNEMEQLEENVRIASETTPGSLTEEELEMFARVKEEIKKSTKVPCTGCGYCMPCPAGVDIPTCFQAYNLTGTEKYLTALKSYMMCTTMKTNPTNASKCIKCGKCEEHCPQSISIRDQLDRVKKDMEGPIFKITNFVAKKVMHF